MKIIAFIEELDIIEKILRHLDLWDTCKHDSPHMISDFILEMVCDETGSRFRYLMNGIDFFEFGLRDYGGLYSKSVQI